ncbi:hypothetical protein [Nonomuraea sp. NPDC049028]|uniref:hypothetical protein n=1 Tax=Nonomuraea sp. NPDC049028 TaxID=3364348 RepID=UPI003720930F
MCTSSSGPRCAAPKSSASIWISFTPPTLPNYGKPKAKLTSVRGKGRTSRTVFLGRDARHAVADCLDAERPGDIDERSQALFLAASSIGALRPRDLRHTFGYRLSEASGHNRAELERRLGHANDRSLRPLHYQASS